MQVKAEFLSPYAHLEHTITNGADMSDKGLFQVESVCVGRADRYLAGSFIVFELDKGLPAVEPEVRVDLNPIEQVGVAFLA